MAEPELIPDSPRLAEIREQHPNLKGFTDPQVAEIVWQKNIVQQGVEDQYDKDLFFQALGTYRNDIDFSDSIARGASRAWYNLSDGLDQVDRQIRDAMPGGIFDDIMLTDDQYADRFVARDTARQRNSMSLEDLNRLLAITSEDSAIGDWTSEIWDISLIGGLLSESFVQYAPALVGSALTTVATGGLAAPIVAAFLIQSGVVGSSAFHEYLREEEGVQTKEDYLRVFNDPDAMNRAVVHGAKYGLPVAALDAFSLGIAGKIAPLIGTAQKATRNANRIRTGKALNNAVSGKRKAARWAGRWTPEVLAQGGLGAGGELAGSYWATGKVNQGEAFLEAILEPMMLPVELAVKSPKATAKALIRKRVKNMSETEVRASLKRKGINTATQTETEARQTLEENMGPIEAGSTATKVATENRKESQDKEYETETVLDMREEVFNLVPLTDRVLEGRRTRRDAGDEEWSSKINKKEITFNAADLAEGQAGTLQDLGYIKEEGAGKYSLTPAGLSATMDTPITERVAPPKRSRNKDGTHSYGNYTIKKDKKKWVVDDNRLKDFTFKNLNEATSAIDNLEAPVEQTVETPVEPLTTEEIVEDEASKVKSYPNYQETASSIIASMQEDIDAGVAPDQRPTVDQRIADALEAADENLDETSKPVEMENILKTIRDVLTLTKKGKPRKKINKALMEEIDGGIRTAEGGLSMLNNEKAGPQVEGTPATNIEPTPEDVAETVTEEDVERESTVTVGQGLAGVVVGEEAVTLDTEAGIGIRPQVEPAMYEFLDLNAEKLTVKQAEKILRSLGQLKEMRDLEAREGFQKNTAVKALAKSKLLEQQELARQQATDANMVADQVTQENYEAGDNTLRTLPPQDQRRLIEWIQQRVGQNVAVAFETVKTMTDTVRELKNLPKNISVQGYANPLDKIIVLALDRKYSQEVAGEEAFHIAARLLLTPEEWAVLNNYDWIAIAHENGIDVSQYPDDLQAWEALAKIASKFMMGEKVVNIGSNNNKIMNRLVRFLNQLANYIRGKGWKKLYPSPQDIFISFDAGQIADRPHNPYPLGPESMEFDLNAEAQLDTLTKGATENLQLPGAKDRNFVTTKIAQGWAYLQEAFNHPTYYSAKNYLFRPVFKIMEEMREFQDNVVLEGLEAFRVYAESSAETQAEADQFITLLDFITTRNNFRPDQGFMRENEDGSITFTMPTTAQVAGEDIQTKLNVLYPDGINGEAVQLSVDEELNEDGEVVTAAEFVEYTISGQKDDRGVSPADAFNSYRNGAEYQKGLLIQAINILVAEMPRNSTVEDLQARVRLLNFEIANSYVEVNEKGEAVESEETKALIKQRDLVNQAIEYTQELNNKPFWVPRIRQGERAVVVKANGKVQHMEVYDQKKFESSKAFEKMLADRATEVRKVYPKGDVGVGDFSLGEMINDATTSPGSFSVVSGLGLVEALFTTLSDPEADNSRIENIIKLIKQETEGKKLKGVEEVRQPQNISGHWRPDLTGYVNMATKRNLHTMSYQLGKVIYKPLIDNQLDEMTSSEAAIKASDPVKAAAIGRTRRYTEKYLAFVNNPKTQGALIRNVVFHTALGGRFSSAVLNLMQLPQALLPFLYSVNSDKFLLDSPYAVAKNVGIVSKAFRDASRLAVKGGWGNLQTAYSMELEGAKPSYLTEGEWQLLRTLFGRGILSPVNLEDLTDKLSYQTLVRDASKAAIPMQALDKAADLSSWMFGSTEFLNRATTALAMYRIARDNEVVLNKVDQIRKQSHFKDSEAVGSMNLTNDEQGWANAAHIAVAETQFMMGKFNRPGLFYKGGALGPIFTQFMSFPFQYVEMMAKNVRRMATPGERAIGARMLSLMVLAMVGMAGVFGLPFMENLRRFILAISDTDLEKDLRKALIDVLGPTYTNVIASGSIFEYLGIEAKQRAGVGTLVDSGIFQGDIGFIFGPLGGVIETAWTNVGAGIEQGDVSKIARGIVPLGFVRDVLGTQLAFEEGYTTQRGTQLIAPQDILPTDYFITFLGFNPANRALERDKQAYARMARTAGQRKRDVVLKRVARLWRKSREATSATDRKEYRDEYTEEIRDWNKRAIENEWPRITPQILNNRFLGNINPTMKLLKRSPKHRRRGFAEDMKMLDRLGNE